jgi:hypothetical protein
MLPDPFSTFVSTPMPIFELAFAQRENHPLGASRPITSEAKITNDVRVLLASD